MNRHQVGRQETRRQRADETQSGGRIGQCSQTKGFNFSWTHTHTLIYVGCLGAVGPITRQLDVAALADQY